MRVVDVMWPARSAVHTRKNTTKIWLWCIVTRVKIAPCEIALLNYLGLLTCFLIWKLNYRADRVRDGLKSIKTIYSLSLALGLRKCWARSSDTPPFLSNLIHNDLQCESKNPPWGLVAIFPKQLGIFQLNFTRLLRVPIDARLRIFIQLSVTLTKLCQIKRDHPVHIMCAKCPPSAKTHFLTFFTNS